MRVVIASDADGMSMKESIKEMLIADGHEVVDYSETPAADFVDSATAVAKDLLEHKDSQGFAFDKYGVGSYMAAVKIKGMVVANISDERSAYMTREHNGSRMVTMGPGVVGTEVAKKIAKVIRGSSGGFRSCKAMGFMLEDRGIAQVSMNMVNYEDTPLYVTYEMIKALAERYGTCLLYTSDAADD